MIAARPDFELGGLCDKVPGRTQSESLYPDTCSRERQGLLLQVCVGVKSQGFGVGDMRREYLNSPFKVNMSTAHADAISTP
jgi:hypothetical protein